MELYKWYKGLDVPDRECDCVVVYCRIDGYYRALSRICIFSKGEYIFKCSSENVSPVLVIAYMPIKFPERSEINGAENKDSTVFLRGKRICKRYWRRWDSFCKILSDVSQL